MDVTTLHAATEDLAGYLSELTLGDLRRPTPRQPRGVGELIERLVADNLELAADLRRRLAPAGSTEAEPDRAVAAQPDGIAGPTQFPDLLHGGGYEIGYRRTAAEVEAAFAAADESVAEITDLYRHRVADARRHARDIAAALGLE